MSSASSQSNIEAEYSLSALLSLLDDLNIDPPSFYLSFQGKDLGSHSSLSTISLYIAPIQKTYLINVHSLGNTTFSTSNSSKTSLKTILESPATPKVIFDIRNSSYDLFTHFGISVDGIKYPQFIELATREGLKVFVTDLTKLL
ncbi:uncharacterized protein BP5553_02826 [Venustampulla echinocandica]|uniref:3'-5' exonuclease domain-containing protein n=1 Tax=Venustampulla echinocandica TaxID=2656787 RepID=A0A370TSI1_9HELO|nr:uncharacterized protein BP5553_02826 [Venustampulla echinocandica]RDL38486.1 hypothetical protein BP5553_02826 [Venustampulla echinocandica]